MKARHLNRIPVGAWSLKPGAWSLEPERSDMILEGERVLLREFTLDDAPAVYEYGSDPDVIRYLDWGPTRTVAEATEFLEGVRMQYQEGTGLVLAVVERATGQVAGNVALMGIDLRRRRAEIGYVLNRRFWGRGYITESGLLLLNHAFTEMQLDEVIAYVDPTNEPSRQVLHRLGMERTPGLHWYTIRGEPILHERYVARRGRFLARKERR
jgi:[ribosomal protein S5]-alanine N-acetyltransferase